MRLTKMWTLLLALGALASCAPVPNEPCAGWRPVRMAGASVDYLAANDPQALAQIVAHYEFGQRMRCW